MNKHPKKKGVKELLSMLGADPNEPPPVNLEEARFRVELEGVQRHTEEYPRCQASGKVCFSSENRAKEAIRARMKKGSNVGKLRAYQCPDCQKWHFTSAFRK